MDALCVGSIVFYVLQLAWYIKMIGILTHYRVPDEIRQSREKRNKKKTL